MAPSPAPLDLPRTWRRTTLATLLALTLCSEGCVRRRLTVRTNPPGALVYVDNQPIGRSPISTDFTYYGTREIRMVKAGYETLTVNQPIPTPWYQVPGVDFVSENLIPFRVRDNRVVSFNMAPQRMIPSEELIGRGEQLRAAANAPIVTPGAGAEVVAPDPFAGSTLTPQAIPPGFTPEPMPTPPANVTPGATPAPQTTPPAGAPAFEPVPTTSAPPTTGAAPFRY